MKELMELKARAYDIIAALEQLQRELTQTNNEIAAKSAELQNAHEKHERGSVDTID